MRASRWLRGLDATHHKLLAAAASRRTLAPGEELDGAALHLVLAGELAAWTPPDPDGVREVVGQEGPGALVGGASLGAPPETPIYRAATPVEVCSWSGEDLRAALAGSGALERRLAVRLSLRAREDEVVALLRRTPLFVHVGAALVRWLVASSTLDLFAAGCEVCRRGERGEEMFLVVAGEIAIGATPSDAIARLHPGDFFGEIALVSGAPRTSSAVALTDAEVLVVDRATFTALDERCAAFAHAVRLTAQRRIEVNVGGPREPELVWLANHDPRVDGAALAALLAQALGERVEAHRPRSVAALDAACDAGRGAAHVLCFSDGAPPARVARELEARAAGVVLVGDAVAPVPRGAAQRVHHVVVAGGTADPQPVRRDALVLRAHPRDLRRPRLDDLPDGARQGVERVARAVARRRVGLALGGGGAWGYAHVALVRALERAAVPIDLVVGVSMGALVGAFYASRGSDGLDRLVDARLELSGAALAAVASTQSVGVFVRRHVAQSRIEELALPFATVAVDARTARERVFRRGPIASAVRASCSLPGVFAPSILGGQRWLDGAVRHNVPASVCVDAGADFVVACDVVPLPGVPRGKRRRGLTGLALDVAQVGRLSDAVRSLYWLTSDSGQRQAAVADAVFSPDLAEYEPWDFPRARAIVASAEEQLDDWLRATAARYRALTGAHG